MISAGTSDGKIARWKRRRDLKNQGLDQQWRLQSSVETDCHVGLVGPLSKAYHGGVSDSLIELVAHNGCPRREFNQFGDNFP